MSLASSGTIRLGTIVAAFGLAIAAATPARAANFVVNGGFETGDFTGWTLSGNTGFMGVQCPGPGPTVAQGNCSAFAGPVGSDGFLNQDLATSAGQSYVLSFEFEPDGGTPSEFAAAFGGTTLLDIVNPSASGFQTRSFLVTASGPVTTLSFSFRDDPGFIFFDAVSVTATPEPASLLLMATGLLAGGFLIRRQRQRQG